MRFPVVWALAAAVASVPPADLSAYAPEPRGLRAAREAVAADYARRGATVDPDAIVLTASTSEAYAWLFALLTDPGDAVLVPEPSYPLFEYLTRLAGVRPRGYRLALEGGRWALDVDSLASVAKGVRVRAVVVVAPNNPTGSSPDPAEWDALTRLCAGQGATLVVDEVFADYAPEGPITAATRQADVLTFTLELER